MWIYLSGVIAIIAIMILGYYIVKEDIYCKDIFFIIFTSIFSWVSVISIIILLLVTFIICLCDNFRNKPIIKWKSRKKDT